MGAVARLDNHAQQRALGWKIGENALMHNLDNVRPGIPHERSQARELAGFVGQIDAQLRNTFAGQLTGQDTGRAAAYRCCRPSARKPDFPALEAPRSLSTAASLRPRAFGDGFLDLDQQRHGALDLAR